jgi:hypothetical protein
VFLLWHAQQAWHGKGELEDYEMANYWDTKFPMNLFGVNPPEVRERMDLELGSQQQLHSRRLLAGRR